MLALSNVQPNNLSKVPFLYSVGEVRKRVCKAFGAEQDFLSTSVLDDICDQRDICCSYASSVLQNWLWPGGCRVPFCGCLETLAAQVSTYFHGFKGDGASQRALDFVEGGRKVLVCFKTSVSPGDNGRAVGYKWCILFFSSCWWHKGKKSSSLAYQNTVTFLFPQENFQSQPSAATDTRFNSCKTLQCLIKTCVWPLFFYVLHTK